MFTSHIDLGQIILATLIAGIGYFIKRIIDQVEKRIDKHDITLYEIYGTVRNIQGILGNRVTDKS